MLYVEGAASASVYPVGTTGTYSFSKTDHLGLDLSAFRILEIKNGGWATVQ